VLYTPTRLAAIASEAAKTDSIFSLADRIGLVHDAFALGKAGYLELSAALNLVHELRSEMECQCLIERWLEPCEANARTESLGLGQHRHKLDRDCRYLVGRQQGHTAA
jgi:hypothetical protein